ncbi:SGNH/GDSL hydrolase family protein [uncultured Eudoraea sp.]|uniref:SGNH/GDSL hydrolase family protein n=1 Tax=uncultured Eudoraea sp. TaxID=1035614 RepID=UPI00262A3E51|nr:SGNH/GDSL hydrolase family protein [uncultured Eudoraea sp.]
MKNVVFFFISIFLFSIHVSAQNFNNIVAFGDSFTDNGYVNGHGFNRDTNGLVWVEYLALLIECRYVDNRAWGGARTDNGHYMGFDWSGFNWQIDQYELTTNAEETLFSVWIGINDYWDNKDDPSNSVRNIKTGLQKLIEKGGKHFIVFNNFDLTLAPGYGPETAYHSLIPAVQELTKEFNSELVNMLFDKKTGLAKSFPGIEIYFVDIYAFMNHLVSNNQFNEKPWKGTYKFPEPETYLWYDEWHPMTSCHKQIAELVLKELKK